MAMQGCVRLGVVELFGWMRRRREAAAWLRGVEHDRRRLVVAADWAITKCRRIVPAGERVFVSIAAVQHEARDQFGMAVPRETAAAVLSERVQLRAALDVDTDATTKAVDVDGPGV